MIPIESILSESLDVRKDSGKGSSVDAGVNTTRLQAALRYADLGYAVFPCVPGGKNPLTEHGFKDATNDIEQITKWWADIPDANIGIATERLLVLDVDGTDNHWLGDQDQKRADLASAPSSQTPHGGRHFWFRQPAGKAWRNTQSKLADHVDTRANGGYIVVSPSCVDGKAYCWLEGYELEIPPENLPVPPGWLVEQLDQIATKPVVAQAPWTQDDKFPEGRRNGALTSLGGAFRRMGLSETSIAAALRQINLERCTPPLDPHEVEHIAASVARYAPDQVAVAVAEGRVLTSELAQPLCVHDLVANHPELRPPVIHGLLRRGETMNVIAPPKTGKSWLVLALAMAVATNRRWLDTFDTVAGDVLIIDNELHRETLAHRIPRVADALQIGMREIAETLSIQSLRGQLHDIFSLVTFFESIEPGRYSLIVLDAFYRFMPRDMDENDNGTMASVYNHIDALADRLGCSFVLIHHSTKGNQSAKSVTDVGAGAGSQSRATDTHLILRQHDEPDAVVLDAAARSWAPIKPLALRWSFPIWTPADDLDASLLRGPKPRGGSKGKDRPSDPPEPDWSLDQFVSEFFSEEPASKAQLRDSTKNTPGLSGRRVADLTEIAESKRLIHRWEVGRGRRVSYATIPQPANMEDQP